MTQPSRSYSIGDQTKALVNNVKYSDCRFLVGNEKTEFYGHRFLLRLGSPLFDCMFEDGQNAEPIEVPDVTPIAFLNMIKFIYGYSVDELDPSELSETFKTADKFVVQALIDDLCLHIRMNLDCSNCIFFYDQLIKMRKEYILPLGELRKFIQESGRAAFQNEHLNRISLYTVVELLQLKRLNISEIEVLCAVSKWLNVELKRNGLPITPENKRRAFQSIKNLIRFTDLTAEQVARFDGIENLLSAQEINSLLLHLVNKSKPLTISYQSPRMKSLANVAPSPASPAQYINSISKSIDELFSISAGMLTNLTKL